MTASGSTLSTILQELETALDCLIPGKKQDHVVENHRIIAKFLLDRQTSIGQVLLDQQGRKFFTKHIPLLRLAVYHQQVQYALQEILNKSDSLFPLNSDGSWNLAAAYEAVEQVLKTHELSLTYMIKDPEFSVLYKRYFPGLAAVLAQMESTESTATSTPPLLRR